MASSSDYRYEVGSSSAQGLVAVTIDGSPVHQHYPDAIEKFRKAGAVVAARLFSQPDLSVSSVSGRSFYSWLSWTQGPPRPLTALSDEERSFLLRGFSEQVEGLRAIAQGDPFLEGFLQAALVTPDTSCLMELEMRPLLVNWGLVRIGVAAPILDDHFQAAIGGLIEPPLHLDAARIGLAQVETWQSDSDSPAAAQAAGFSPGVSGVGSTSLIGGAPGSMSAVDGDATAPYRGATPAEPTSTGTSAHKSDSVPLAAGGHVIHTMPLYARIWFFPLIALLLALLLLLYLLWPGNLIYAARSALVTEPSATAITAESNAALSHRIEQLQTALADINNCSFDPALLRRPLSMPPVLPADGRGPSAAGTGVEPGGSQGAGTDAASSQGAALDNPSGSPSSPPAAAMQEIGEMSLLQTMDQATVLVVGENSDGLSTGSGFFVDPRTIITNAHVVDSVLGDTVFISNNHIGLQPARIIAKDGGQTPGDADFALLRTEADMDVRPMQVSTSISRLLAVIAAGYPAFVTEGDEAYQQALRGDADAFRRIQLVVTRGNVTSVQNASAGMLIAHTAQTSPGNSGGPLIDECGRVVGVNTFVRSGSELNIHLNYALSAETLFRYASSHGVTIANAPGACAPPPAPVAAAAHSGQP